MVRQPKTGKRRYARMSAERNRIKCGKCGTETSSPAIIRENGVSKWVCQACKKYHDKKNGTH